mgnify:CR=1 FL=1
MWVIEGDKKILDEFPFDKAGLNIIVTDNLEMYRTRKVRILNGAHTSLVPYALLEGFDTMVHLSEDSHIAIFEGDEYLSSPIDRRPKFHHYYPASMQLHRYRLQLRSLSGNHPDLPARSSRPLSPHTFRALKDMYCSLPSDHLR